MSKVETLTVQKSELEQSQSNWEFGMTISLSIVVLAALAVLFADWGIRRASKRLQSVQDEIIREKDSDTEFRIEQVRADAKRDAARIESEGKAKIAGLETAASDAKAAQQKVEIELNKQKTKAAEAELALLELKEQQKPRHLDEKQLEKFLPLLKQLPSQKVNMFVYTGDTEIVGITNEITLFLVNRVGWQIKVAIGNESSRSVGNILIEVDSKATPQQWSAAGMLAEALRSKKVVVNVGMRPASPTSSIFTGEIDKDAPITVTVGRMTQVEK